MLLCQDLKPEAVQWHQHLPAHVYSSGRLFSYSGCVPRCILAALCGCCYGGNQAGPEAARRHSKDSPWQQLSCLQSKCFCSYVNIWKIKSRRFFFGGNSLSFFKKKKKVYSGIRAKIHLALLLFIPSYLLNNCFSYPYTYWRASGAYHSPIFDHCVRVG